MFWDTVRLNHCFIVETVRQRHTPIRPNWIIFNTAFFLKQNTISAFIPVITHFICHFKRRGSKGAQRKRVHSTLWRWQVWNPMMPPPSMAGNPKEKNWPWSQGGEVGILLSIMTQHFLRKIWLAYHPRFVSAVRQRKPNLIKYLSNWRVGGNWLICCVYMIKFIVPKTALL